MIPATRRGTVRLGPAAAALGLAACALGDATPSGQVALVAFAGGHVRAETVDGEPARPRFTCLSRDGPCDAMLRLAPGEHEIRVARGWPSGGWWDPVPGPWARHDGGLLVLTVREGAAYRVDGRPVAEDETRFWVTELASGRVVAVTTVLRGRR